MKSLIQFINENKLNNDPCYNFLNKLRVKQCEKLNIDPIDFDTQIIDYEDDTMLAICNSIQTFPFAYFPNKGCVHNVNDYFDVGDKLDIDDIANIIKVIQGRTHRTVIVFNQKQQIVACFNEGLIEVINKNNAYYDNYQSMKDNSFFDKLSLNRKEESIIKLPDSQITINTNNLKTFGDYADILFDLAESKAKQLGGVLKDKGTKIYILYQD